MLILFAISAASIASCPIERAHYSLRTAPHVTAAFRRVDSDADWQAGLALATRFRDTGRTYWWLPWGSGSGGWQHVASTTDVADPRWRPPSPDGGPRPLGDLGYVATDADYDLIDTLPGRGDIAPMHILLADLGDAVWHGTPAEPRDRAPRQFFDLVRCDR